MKKEKRKKSIKEKLAVLSQVFSLIIEIFAFAFIIGGMTLFAGTEIVSADSLYPQGCCPEANDGSVCQEMIKADEAMCKTGLVATDCTFIEDCQAGCCYSRQEGICSLNSPKKKCEDSGGVWSSNAQCDIQECQLGCCVVGDQAMVTTSRECTKKSGELGLNRNFQPMNPDGTCNSFVGLAEKGACITSTGDFSGENNCKFTTKEQCEKTGGDFYKNFLCTAKALNTTCLPAKKTICLEDKDQIYYLDTCNNPANVYDANKFDNEAYWTKVILASDASVCQFASASCGNCDYRTGSICREFRLARDTRPVFGNNVCRNLNCANGKKHGESWCISDYSNTGASAVAPVGSRWFKGTCLDGEITIEPCADFNQELCFEGGSGDKTEAICIPNEWRNCIAANEKESYEEVKEECKKYPQCVMFLDISGNDKYKGLPGFKDSGVNGLQGNSGDVGKTANSVMAHCVPKQTPGLVFWTPEQKFDKFGLPAQTGIGNGGSLDETKAICTMAGFTCVTRFERDVGVLDKGPWEPKENLECMFDGYEYEEIVGVGGVVFSQEQADALNAENKKKQQLWIEGLQERCRSLGPCGVTVNIAGELGSNKADKSFKRINVDTEGNAGDKYVVTQNKLRTTYVDSVKSKPGVKKPGSMASVTGMILTLVTGMATTEADTAAQQAAGAGDAADYSGEAAAIGGLGYLAVQTSAGAASAALLPMGTILGWTAVAAGAGYVIGGLVGKWLGLSSAQTGQLSLALAAGLGAGILAYEIVGWAGYVAEAGPIGWIVGGIALLVCILFCESEESKYYVTEYTCEPWQPPMTGDCSSCNKDIRPCSEYRCKSLGTNCQYYNDNGEPGYCSAISGIWSATIKPWPDALTPGNRYASVTGGGFKIDGSGKGNTIEAWKSIQFGIIVDEPATCKIDNKHTQSFDEMAVNMQLDVTKCESSTGVTCNSNQGTHHKVALVQQVLTESQSGAEEETSDYGEATLPMYAGENNYYIRCRNFAGQDNEAEFAVKVIVDDSPDYSPPNIIQFNPESGKYIKMGDSSKAIIAWVDEPADCKYSQNQNLDYFQMNKTLLCATDISSSVLGRFPCYATLQNLSAGANVIYFQCADQPDIEARMSESRNINRNSKEYLLNVCETGLNITRIYPTEKITTGKSPISLTVEAETAGCIDGGKSMCYFSFNGAQDVAFLNTDATQHSQIFTDMPAGNHSIGIRCTDEAGNSDNKTIRANIILDNSNPIVTRAYEAGNQIVIRTNENSACKYSNDTITECDFSFESENLGLMSTSGGLLHYAPWIRGQNYFIKCADEYNNTNFGCGIAVQASEVKTNELAEEIAEWEYY